MILQKYSNSSLIANDNQIYMDYQDGKYGINTDSQRGADTFIPFSNYEKFYSSQITFPNAKTSKRIEFGFKPDFFMLGLTAQNTNSVWWYDSELNNGYIVYNGHLDQTFSVGTWYSNLIKIVSIDDTGLNFLSNDSHAGKAGFVLAFKFK